MTNDPIDPIDLAALRKSLRGTLFETNLLHYDILESTNDLAKSLAAGGAPEGTVVVADSQTAGRGRMGRSWLSRPGANLLFSVILRPPVQPDRVFAVTMILALSAAEVLHRRAGLPAGIKWPNDLFAGPKKLAGILTEMGVKGGTLEYVVVGMGLNVHWYPQGAEEMKWPATSMVLETGRSCRREDLLAWILGEFETGYRMFLGGENEPLYSRWNDLSVVLGRDVAVESGEERVCGRVLHIDRDGAMILEERNGTRRRIVSGDVSLEWEAA